MIDENGVRYEECIVGNIIGKHFYGPEKEIKYGTKHFSPGTKVYCAFIYGGAGNENILVFGKPRKSFRMITVVLRRQYIKNFRKQKVYSPKVLKFIDEHICGSPLPDTWVEWLKDNFNNSHLEID
jgi:hypothetical protein